jgi:hypothetical protein
MLNRITGGVVLFATMFCVAVVLLHYFVRQNRSSVIETEADLRNEVARVVNAARENADAIIDRDLANEYEHNQVRAGQLFTGKFLVVAGIVTGIKDNADGFRVLLDQLPLYEQQEHSVHYVKCCFDDDDTESRTAVAALSHGEVVYICGECRGMGSGDHFIYMTQCKIATLTDKQRREILASHPSNIVPVGPAAATSTPPPPSKSPPSKARTAT